MADTLYFSRDTKVWLERGTSTPMFSEIPVLDGFSFSQATNSSEITLSEASTSAGVSRRARQVFNDSYAPAEWSFQTYVRPFKSAGGTRGTDGKTSTNAGEHAAVEQALWDAFVSNGEQLTGLSFNSTDDFEVNWSVSNKTTLGTFNLYFELGGANSNTELIYKIADCVVNEAVLDFDIEGIAMITWSGFGTIITDVASVGHSLTTKITEGVSSTSNYIRNKLTDLTIANTGFSGRGTAALTTTALAGTGTKFTQDLVVGQSIKMTSATIYVIDSITSDTEAVTTASGTETDAEYTIYPVGLAQQSYTITLTGGSITFSNNITFLTPETIGSVNQPLGHVSGTRSISGSFTAYLGADSAVTTSPADLLEDLIEATTAVQNSYALTFDIGGGSGIPRVEIVCTQAHLEIPTHEIADVLGMEVNFHALPSTIDGTDETTVTYIGASL